MDLAVLFLVVVVEILIFKYGSKTSKAKKLLVRELKNLGRLKRDVEALELRLNKKNREIQVSKDRSVDLREQFIQLQKQVRSK